MPIEGAADIRIVGLNGAAGVGRLNRWLSTAIGMGAVVGVLVACPPVVDPAPPDLPLSVSQAVPLDGGSVRLGELAEIRFGPDSFPTVHTVAVTAQSRDEGDIQLATLLDFFDVTPVGPIEIVIETGSFQPRRPVSVTFFFPKGLNPPRSLEAALAFYFVSTSDYGTEYTYEVIKTTYDPATRSVELEAPPYLFSDNVLGSMGTYTALLIPVEPNEQAEEELSENPFLAVQGASEKCPFQPVLCPIEGGCDAPSSAFGQRLHPVRTRWEGHAGIDLPVPVGSEVNAAGAGTVEAVGSLNGYGNTIIIRHNDGSASLYGHLDSNYDSLVEVGDEVEWGQHFTYSGNTGTSTGPHLHFETGYPGRPFKKGVSRHNPSDCIFEDRSYSGSFVISGTVMSGDRQRCPAPIPVQIRGQVRLSLPSTGGGTVELQIVSRQFGPYCFTHIDRGFSILGTTVVRSQFPSNVEMTQSGPSDDWIVELVETARGGPIAVTVTNHHHYPGSSRDFSNTGTIRGTFTINRE